ncbi:MAG: tetratricopeptide repeat protein [Acidobacteriota bacterium]|nr:MAG: tetratricopeptide repeat protein [Acidobacteriota bacterium]
MSLDRSYESGNKTAKNRQFVVGLVFSVMLFVLAPAIAAQNSISGIVFDPDNKPVGDIEVELLDTFERLIGTRKTSGSGFYTFQRLGAGVYYLKIRPGGTAFSESKQRIDLGDLNAIGGVDQKQVDIHLEFDPRMNRNGAAINGVVFAQAVPEEARHHFENASKAARKQPERAIVELEKALSLFPDYFAALELSGDLKLANGDFEGAEAAFGRAVEVNARCFGCFFNLAVAQNKLGRKPEAASNLVRANEIDPGSINANLLLGMILRDLKRFDEAESALLKAKGLSGNEQPDVNWQLAELYYFDLKEPKKAKKELESYLSNLSDTEKRQNSGKVETIRKLIRQIESEISGGS